MGVDWRTIPENRPGSELVKGIGYFAASIGVVAVFALAGLGVANAQYETSVPHIQNQKEKIKLDGISDKREEPAPVPEEPSRGSSERKETVRAVPAEVVEEVQIEPAPDADILQIESYDNVEPDDEYVEPDGEYIEPVERGDDAGEEENGENAGASAYYSGDEFRFEGRVVDGDHEYTWYSEDVLPGEGLDIPGRHVDDEGYVRDGDGNLCVASNGYSYGTVLDVPFGDGKAVVYDSCEDEGDELVDVYVSW